MPNDEKDRYGDTLRDAERGHEDSYFARRDRELIQRLRQQTEAGPKCSTCGATLPVTADNEARPRCPICSPS